MEGLVFAYKRSAPLHCQFLVTLSDFSSFSAVCRSWRFSSCVVSRLTMSSQSPLFLLYHRRTKYFFDATHLRIYKSPRGLPWGIRTCRIFGYTHGHLVAAPRKPHRPILLVHFFTGTKTKLPPMPTPTDDEFVPEHLLLSSSPGCIAVLLGSSKCFFYCRLGDPHWTRYQLQPPHSVVDVVFVGNRLYALTTDGRLGFLSFVSPHPVFTAVLEASSINVEEANSRWRLAESAGDLLAIRCIGAPFDYDIWRWDLEGDCGFVEVSSLGQRALFFANGRFAGSLAASIRSGIAGNSIYHTHQVYSVDTKRVMGGFTEYPEYYRYGTIPVWILPSLC